MIGLKRAGEFNARCQECQTGGLRHTYFLYAFSGKDLLAVMAPSLARLGFASVSIFLEKVLVAIDQAQVDIVDWLLEWRELRQLIEHLG